MTDKWKKINLWDNDLPLNTKSDLKFEYGLYSWPIDAYCSITKHYKYIWVKEKTADNVFFRHRPDIGWGHWEEIPYDRLPEELRKEIVKEKI